MSKQNYNNHVRWYPPHHFIFYPLMMGLFIAALYNAYVSKDRLLWFFISAIIAVIVRVAFMLRQHYALTLQNRLVLAELRYRYLAVTGSRLEPLEIQLTEGQLFALRFAPDEELAALAEKAIANNLSPDAIKKSIHHWKDDNRRV